MASMGVATAPASDNEQAIAAQRLAAEQKVVSAAKWFYWIAGFSVINAVTILAGVSGRFVIGMGVIDFVAALGSQSGKAGIGAAIVVTAFVTGLCALFGSLALKKHAWAFWIGMMLYAFDGLILLLAGDIFSAGFHGLALFFLFQGPMALRQLKSLDDSPMASRPVTSRPLA